MKKSLSDIKSESTPSLPRRRFILGLAASAGSAALTSCGGGGKDNVIASASPVPQESTRSAPTGASLGSNSGPTIQPAWVPPAGYFADIPTVNTPQAATPELYLPYGRWARDTYERWSGGAYIADYGTLGATAIFGGGHEATKGAAHMQGVVLLDYGTLMYQAKSIPPNVNVELFNDGFDGQYPDGSYYRAHIYMGMAPIPKAWGTTQGGGFVHFAQAGSGYPNKTLVYDMAYDKGGYSSLTPVIDFSRNGSLTRGAFTFCTIDHIRQGWWVWSQNGNDRSCFINKDGIVTYRTPSLGGGYNSKACAFHIPERDVIVHLQGGMYQGAVKGNAFNDITIFDPKTNSSTYAKRVSMPRVRHGDMGHSGYVVPFPREVSSYLISNPGAGYAVGDKLQMEGALVAPATTSYTKARIVVTSVDAGGRITASQFDTSSNDGYTYEERGQYSTNLPYINNTKDTADEQCTFTASGGTGAGATFAAHMTLTNDTTQPGDVGMFWSTADGCAVGYNNGTGKVVVLRPSDPNDLSKDWIWSFPELRHWASGDPAGSESLRQSVNGMFSKIHYADKLGAYVLHARYDVKPQVFRLPADFTQPIGKFNAPATPLPYP
jgi:hypothetical protein